MITLGRLGSGSDLIGRPPRLVGIRPAATGEGSGFHPVDP